MINCLYQWTCKGRHPDYGYCMNCDGDVLPKVHYVKSQVISNEKILGELEKVKR